MNTFEFETVFGYIIVAIIVFVYGGAFVAPWLDARERKRAKANGCICSLNGTYVWHIEKDCKYHNPGGKNGE